MKSREQVLSILRKKKMYLKTTYGVDRMALFGSVSRQEQTKHSDIDLAVTYSRKVTWREYISLKDELEEWLGAKVDLGKEELIKPHYRPLIEADLIYA